jgi:hypothetical protein
MENEENTLPKKNLIHNIIDELNKNDILQKCLRPCTDHIKLLIKPYYTAYIISQLVIICLLILILYLMIRGK